MEGDSGGGKKNRGHGDLGSTSSSSSSSSISFIPTPTPILVLVLVLVLGYQKWHVLGMASLHGEEDFMLGPKMRSF